MNRFVQDQDEPGESVGAVEGMVREIRKVWKGGKGDKVTVISSGPLTNIALFISIYSNMIEQGAIEEFVFLGGGVGIGNRSPVAEYNIMTDRASVKIYTSLHVRSNHFLAHAAQIVLNSPVKTTMIPINASHKAIVTYEIQHRLLTGAHPTSAPGKPIPGSPYPSLPNAKTPLRHTLSTIIAYFAASYQSVFGFHSGPPLHDALTIAYVQRPDLFQGTRYRVDVELNEGLCKGETVVDIWNYKGMDEKSWGREGKNCFVVQEVDVSIFFSSVTVVCNGISGFQVI